MSNPNTLSSAGMTLTNNYTLTPGDPNYPAGNNKSLTVQSKYTTGGSSNQAQLVFVKRVTVAASGTTTLNLADGSLSDPNNGADAFVKIKGFAFSLPSITGQASAVKIDGTVSNSFSPFVDTIVTGGFCGHADPSAAGIAVSTSGARLVTLENQDSTNTASVDVFFIGA